MDGLDSWYRFSGWAQSRLLSGSACIGVNSCGPPDGAGSATLTLFGLQSQGNAEYRQNAGSIAANRLIFRRFWLQCRPL